MGLLRGEGTILCNKYMKKYGLTQLEATDKVSEFVQEINHIRDEMKTQRKAEAEIDLNIQKRFEEEFQRLCV